ncbi:unnamed protein product [Durusdinium trenchii]|uniref:EGF-like domain-containing protein n=1 Tax=Durusdinium trenchii TaxID=1381693 RepID=A0ABP0RH00_9DINO
MTCRIFTLLAVVVPGVWSTWSWSTLEVQGAPSKRQGHASVEVGRKIYIIGGCVQEIRCFNDVHVFDTGTQKWSQELVSGAPPAPRGGHTATLVGSDIFVIGGANSQATLGDVYRLDLVRKRWTKLEQPAGLKLSNRTSHAAVATTGGRLFLFGGYDAEGNFLNDLWVLRPTLSPPFSPDAPDVLETAALAWSRPVPVGEVPEPREGHSLTLLDEQLLLFGGYTAAGTETNDLHMYDISKQTWKQVAVSGAGPSPRQAHSAARHGHQLVVAGGCSGSVCFSDVWSFDPMALRWTQRSSSPMPWREREGHSATFVGGHMFVFGGCQVSSECFNDVSVLDTLEPCPEQCAGHGTCVDGLYCQCTTPGFTGHDCLQPLTCHLDCGLHGSCGQDGQCACSNGWSGHTCQDPPRCPGAPLPCSGRGECLAGGTCRCQAGAAGLDCFADATNHSNLTASRPFFARRLVQHLLSFTEKETKEPRLQNGQSISPADFGIHVNEDGHEGEASPDCEDNCHWRGLCDAGVCYCQPGFSGRTCSVAKENTDGTISIVATGAMAGVSFLCSLGITMTLLYAQQKQKRAKDMDAGYNAL